MIASLEQLRERIGSIVSGDWRHPDRRPLSAFASERTKRVRMEALEEARLSGQDRIGTEHLLLGILAENSGRAVTSLRRRNVLLSDVRPVVELLNGTNPTDPGKTKWFHTHEYHAAMFAAAEYSRTLDHPTIEPEHVLYAILQEDATASRILRYLEVSASDLLLDL